MAEVTAMLGLGAKLPSTVGKVCGALMAGCGACAALANRYANDPPDPDFHASAIRSPPVVPTAALEQEARADAVVLAFANDLNESYAYTSAALRAYERAQAAAIRNAGVELRERLRESREHAEAGASQVDLLAGDAERLAVILPPMVADETGRPASPPLRVEDLPDATLAFLYRSGVTLAALGRALDVAADWSVGPVVVSGAALRELGVASRKFSRFLVSWQPDVELRDISS
jgi:hypothetical protein